MPPMKALLHGYMIMTVWMLFVLCLYSLLMRNRLKMQRLVEFVNIAGADAVLSQKIHRVKFVNGKD